MALKTALYAGIFAVLPVFAFSMCSKGMHETTASTCAEGQVWDETTSLCVDMVTG